MDRVALGAGFLRVLRFPLPIIILPNYPSSESPGAGTIGQLVGDVPSGPGWTPTLGTLCHNRPGVAAVPIK
jgi:hypothetical protein